MTYSFKSLENKDLKFKALLYLSIVYIIFTAITLYFDHTRITQNFLGEHTQKNKDISKITYSLLESLKDDTNKKIGFILEKEDVKEAFFKQDRQKMYNLVYPYYKRQHLVNKYLKIMTFRNADGSVFLRLHKPEMYGDAVNPKRKIILDTNENQHTHYGFEVGKLKMSYRVVVPIFYKKKHIGLVEVGIEPEFLIDRLIDSYNIKKALLVKKDKVSASIQNLKNNKIKDDFIMVRGDKLFDENIDNINLAEGENKFIEFEKSYYLVETGLNLNDHHSNITAKLLFATKIDNFDKKNKVLIFNFIFISLFFILLFLVINYLVNRFIDIQQKQIDIMNNESKKNELIFNGASSILVLTDSRNIIDANEEFLLFFDEYKNIDEFKKEFDCICDKFVCYEGVGYICDKEIDGIPWNDYIISNSDLSHKVVMTKANIQHHFSIKIKEITYLNDILQVVDLTDITKEMEQELIILEQSKLASMGEMIGNIAHQWRQPLSVISTGVTGMQVQKEFGLLEDKQFSETCDMINKNAQYLSKTIDDFRNFIKGDRVKVVFKLENEIDSLLILLEGTIKNNDIKVILDLEKDITINGYENELTQALINIFNNSKDVLKEKNVKEKLVFITTRKEKDKVKISIKDNGGGVPSDIIGKIFEPYFTTKHKSQGTGLGLHMTYNLIVRGMAGEIVVNNVSYEYNEKKYDGAEITIIL